MLAQRIKYSGTSISNQSTAGSQVLKFTNFRVKCRHQQAVCKAYGDVGCKVTIVGANNDTGRHLSLLLKMNRLITQLALYDQFDAEAITNDLNQCNTDVAVKSYTGKKSLGEALRGSSLVVLLQGSQLRSSSTRPQLFAANAPITLAFAEAYRQNCPDALIAVQTQPVEQMVVMCSEYLKMTGVNKDNKIMGVATLDVVRANTLVSALCELELAAVNIKVAGGVGDFAVPLLGSSVMDIDFTDPELLDIIQGVQQGSGDPNGSPLASAYALARFTDACLMAISGDQGIRECAFVAARQNYAPYFTCEVELGQEGIEKVVDTPSLNAVERRLLDEILGDLTAGIVQAQSFTQQYGGQGQS